MDASERMSQYGHIRKFIDTQISLWLPSESMLLGKRLHNNHGAVLFNERLRPLATWLWGIWRRDPPVVAVAIGTREVSIWLRPLRGLTQAGSTAFMKMKQEGPMCRARILPHCQTHWHKWRRISKAQTTHIEASGTVFYKAQNASCSVPRRLMQRRTIAR